MAYGDIRALRKDGNYYCVRCACKLIESGQIGLKSGPLVPETIARAAESVAIVDPNNLYTFENDGISAFILGRLVNQNWLAIDDNLREGQYPDQRVLEEHACAKCGKLLREDCEDY